MNGYRTVFLNILKSTTAFSLLASASLPTFAMDEENPWRNFGSNLTGLKIIEDDRNSTRCSYPAVHALMDRGQYSEAFEASLDFSDEIPFKKLKAAIEKMFLLDKDLGANLSRLSKGLTTSEKVLRYLSTKEETLRECVVSYPTESAHLKNKFDNLRTKVTPMQPAQEEQNLVNVSLPTVAMNEKNPWGKVLFSSPGVKITEDDRTSTRCYYPEVHSLLDEGKYSEAYQASLEVSDEIVFKKLDGFIRKMYNLDCDLNSSLSRLSKGLTTSEKVLRYLSTKEETLRECVVSYPTESARLKEKFDNLRTKATQMQPAREEQNLVNVSLPTVAMNDDSCGNALSAGNAGTTATTTTTAVTRTSVPPHSEIRHFEAVLGSIPAPRPLPTPPVTTTNTDPIMVTTTTVTMGTLSTDKIPEAPAIPENPGKKEKLAVDTNVEASEKTEHSPKALPNNGSTIDSKLSEAIKKQRLLSGHNTEPQEQDETKGSQHQQKRPEAHESESQKAAKLSINEIQTQITMLDKNIEEIEEEISNKIAQIKLTAFGQVEWKRLKGEEKTLQDKLKNAQDTLRVYKAEKILREKKETQVDSLQNIFEKKLENAQFNIEYNKSNFYSSQIWDD